MKEIILPKPQIDLDFPLMKALQKRSTIRKWKLEDLPLQEISNILWCACGETKPAAKRNKNKRTIPSGCNSQLVSVYAAMDTGVYRYNEAEHKLEQVINEDIRNNLGKQKIMKTAPFGLIYIADFNKNTGIMKSDYGQKMFLGGTEAGSMSQNVYLYCACANLNTVLLALVDRDHIKSALKLNKNCEVIYTQVVGKAV